MRDLTKKQLQSFMLPITVTIIIPTTILLCAEGGKSFWGAHYFHIPTQLIFGVAFVAFGFTLLATSIRLFGRIGKGTLAPWYPTQHIVVTGLYAYTRNPMISGVLFILQGESVIFGSGGILLWFFIFFVVNTTYFVLFEEPGLQKRFGEEYAEYKRHVPRWIPRITPWKAGD